MAWLSWQERRAECPEGAGSNPAAIPKNYKMQTKTKIIWKKRSITN